jgi:hypothetical protein
MVSAEGLEPSKSWRSSSLTLPTGSRSSDALMELVVSHGVEGVTRLLHEAADALLQNEGFGAEQAAEAGMASILLPGSIDCT